MNYSIQNSIITSDIYGYIPEYRGFQFTVRTKYGDKEIVVLINICSYIVCSAIILQVLKVVKQSWRKEEAVFYTSYIN
jgi:hypothetical protein